MPALGQLSTEVRRAIGLRRSSARAGREVKIKWFIKEANDKVSLTMKKRTQLASALVYDVVVRNISVAVKKETGPRGRVIVTQRSTEGEFPRADTNRLLKDIFWDVKNEGRGNWVGYVGTTLDYGLILELKMNRSFLKRTLDENRSLVNALLTGPIK